MLPGASLTPAGLAACSCFIDLDMEFHSLPPCHRKLA